MATPANRLRRAQQDAEAASKELATHGRVLSELARKQAQEGARRELALLEQRNAAAHMEVEIERRLAEAREELGKDRVARILDEVQATLRKRHESDSPMALLHELRFALQDACKKGKHS